MKEPSTKRLTKLASTKQPFRLLAADRAFLRDLGRVNIISNDMAKKYHYGHLKGGCERSLARLEAAGLIESKKLHLAGRAPLKTYQFANLKQARLWGGSLPVTGAKRNEMHELITSRLYFETGKPADFRLAYKFSNADIATVGGCRPDALYTDASTGALVAVEADGGNYSRKQIIEKLARWNSVGIKHSVWGQPSYAVARVPALQNISIYRF